MPVKSLYIEYRTNKKNSNYLDLESSFNLFSRPLCHFVGQFVKKHDTEKSGFNKIVFLDEETPQAKLFKNKYYTNSSHCLMVFFDFPIDEFKKLLTKNKETLAKTNGLGLYQVKEINFVHNYFVGILKQGIQIIKNDFPTLSTHIQDGIDAFIENNYQDKWTHKIKTNGKNLKVSIVCELILDSFSAHIEIIKDKKVVLYELIKLDYNKLSYKDEFMLGYQLKDIKFNNNTIEIWDRVKVTHRFIIPE